MMNGPNGAADRVGADAVLGVDDIACATVEFISQNLDGPDDPVGDGVTLEIVEARQPDRNCRIDLAEESRIPAAGQ